MAKGGGSLGDGRRTEDEVPSVPDPESLGPDERNAQQLLRSVVDGNGGRFGFPPDVPGRIPADGIDIGALTDFADSWIRSHSADDGSGGLRHSGQPGLWHCFDDLYPLQHPDRWNKIRSAVADELMSRGWERPGGRHGAPWVLPDRLRVRRRPPGFLLTFNPSNWDWPQDDRISAILATGCGRAVPGRWSVGNRKSGIELGDRAYLLQQGSDRGVIASGSFTSLVYRSEHWDGTGRLSNYADLEWDTVLDDSDRLPVETLRQSLPAYSWDRVQGSGVLVPDTLSEALGTLWRTHIASITYTSPEEISSPESFTEGAVTTVSSNRYERNRHARSRCLEHWGTSCSVCEMDFATTYGDRGKDFIHVHHSRELSSIGESYTVDPIHDLRPVCPNCHAMLHQTRPAMTVDELRSSISKL